MDRGGGMDGTSLFQGLLLRSLDRALLQFQLQVVHWFVNYSFSTQLLKKRMECAKLCLRSTFFLTTINSRMHKTKTDYEGKESFIFTKR